MSGWTAARVRHEMNEEALPTRGGALFWVLWIFGGLGLGLGYHLYLLQQLKAH